MLNDVHVCCTAAIVQQWNARPTEPPSDFYCSLDRRRLFNQLFFFCLLFLKFHMLTLYIPTVSNECIDAPIYWPYKSTLHSALSLMILRQGRVGRGSTIYWGKIIESQYFGPFWIIKKVGDIKKKLFQSNLKFYCYRKMNPILSNKFVENQILDFGNFFKWAHETLQGLIMLSNMYPCTETNYSCSNTAC